jgi:hypothetical protein
MPQIVTLEKIQNHKNKKYQHGKHTNHDRRNAHD